MSIIDLNSSNFTTGANTTGPFNLIYSVLAKFNKLNNICFLTLQGFTVPANGASAAPLTLSLNLPFKPTDTHSCPIWVFDNNNYTMGTLQISTSGAVKIFVSTGSNFQNAGSCGFATITVSYPIN